MKYTEKISNKLNDLLILTYDAKRGYKLAAEKVDNPAIKKFLEDKANQRHNFGHELKSEIVEYGNLPEDSGSIKGDFHRAWMKFVTTISSSESERMLEEVNRGEKKILNSYNDILNNKEWILPNTTRDLLSKQRDAIKSALETSKMYEEVVS
ncbi:ferritin-like domain-containing protein [Muriicola sp.]|uniref:ferritin-like domain-containing protein n=1 Tax=Muriicola sp. TaxID=2020856 RepID=UPI003C70E5C7